MAHAIVRAPSGPSGTGAHRRPAWPVPGHADDARGPQRPGVAAAGGAKVR
mgnify:CR=1 FL=1|jgi:hypothetical protein